MSNLTITFQENSSIFEADIPVLVSHLNYGNHLGYDSILSIVQEARMRWLKQYNMGEMTIDENIGYLVIDVSLIYKSEAFHGDTLNVQLYPENVKSKSFNLKYKITNQTTGATVALVNTRHIFYNFLMKKIVRSPESFNDLISRISQKQLIAKL